MIERIFTERNSLTLYVLLLLISSYLTYHYYPLLPEKIATHFGASFKPDGYSDKAVFEILFKLLELFLIAMFIGVNYFMKHAKDNLINLPNKEYWLAPERREKSLYILKANMSFFGALTIAYMVFNQVLIYIANLSEPVQLGDSFWIGFVIYMFSTMGWLIRMIMLFSKKKIVEELEDE